MEKQARGSRQGLSDAEKGGEGYLKSFGKKEIPRYVLVPGDPDRISVMAKQWDEANEYSMLRGFRGAVGNYKGASIAAVASGIGGPSLEGILTATAELGGDTFIRVGTTGAIQEGIENGDLIIDEAAVRLDGTSHMYVRDEYPAAASFEVTMALVQAAESFGFRYHVGVGCTTASFYAGQGRTSFGGYKLSTTDDFFNDMRAARVINFEQEGSALLTLCRLFGCRAGVVASVIAQRLTGIWDDAGGVERACLVGAEAVRILSDWDAKKEKANKKYFYPDLLK
jgi:uridine phosphorylase